MKTLNELAIEYKKTKNKIILNQLFVLLQSLVKAKAKHTFYKRKFVKRMIDVEMLDNEGTQKIIQRLPQCFKLVDTHLLELEDVEQELNLEILSLLEKYDVSRPFDKFLYSSLWNWKPNFINKDFINQLGNVSLSAMTEEDNENSELMNNFAVYPKFDETFDVCDMFSDLTELEEKLLNLLKVSPDANQTQLAKKLYVTQARVSQMLTEIRKKYRSGL
jgi:hypothetical protein